ncbi:diguanylate cyclase [Lacibacterium aquatile]|uniref:diguanylate cyclase n=2 Tax=Lacibacterium aquatile TaxID=1168082 RepID=A0ABW5DLX9_9PROT
MAVISAVLVAGFLSTNIISYQISTAALKETILRNELPLTSSNIYAEIQADLLEPLFVSSLMAHDTFVRTWLENGEMPQSHIVSYLAEIRKRYSVFTAFLISDRTKNYYHFSGVPQVVDEADPEDVWFFRMRGLDKPYEINLDFNQAQSNTPTVFINYRMTDAGGKFLALTGVGLELEGLTRILSHYADDERRNIYFVDQGGRVTVRAGRHAAENERLQDISGLARLAPKLLSSNSGYYDYVRDGEPMLATARLIPELGWYVLVEQREADAMRDLQRGFWVNSLIGVVIVLLTVGLIFYAVAFYQRRLEEMATTDKLTGLVNRQVFDDALEAAVKKYRRSVDRFSLILIDIDHFKNVNDTYGHLMGDKVLRQISDLVRHVMRDSDIVCRWGGEEIIVLAHNCPQDDAATRAEDLLKAIESAVIETDHGRLVVTVSAGVTQGRPDDTADTLLLRADAALYRAKDTGRNRVCIAD